MPGRTARALYLLGLCVTLWAAALQGQRAPAFPGAEGFGATAFGGRGKAAVLVTNLNDEGAGSFREAVEKGNAMVLFTVGGVVHLKSDLHIGSNLTIAGQTAPGSGITIAGAKVSLSDSSNVVIRFVRFRGGMAESAHTSSLNLGNAAHVMLDHLSVEWGRWDDIQTNGNTDTTLQNSIVGQGIVPQRFGCLCESDFLTLSHNLWIDNKSRNPKGKGRLQYVNNIVYNWGVDGYVGGHSGAPHQADLVGNYFIKGPDSSDSFIGEFTATDLTYQAGNLVDLNRNGKLDGRAVTAADFQQAHAALVEEPFAHPAVPVHVDPAEALVPLLAPGVGDSLCRDVVDANLVAELLSFGSKGRLIASEADAGGHPAVVFRSAPLDSDHDGIPDDWEIAHGLNPHDASDATTVSPLSGYTNLEIYLNELAAKAPQTCPEK